MSHSPVAYGIQSLSPLLDKLRRRHCRCLFLAVTPREAKDPEARCGPPKGSSGERARRCKRNARGPSMFMQHVPKPGAAQVVAGTEWLFNPDAPFLAFARPLMPSRENLPHPKNKHQKPGAFFTTEKRRSTNHVLPRIHHNFTTKTPHPNTGFSRTTPKNTSKNKKPRISPGFFFTHFLNTKISCSSPQPKQSSPRPAG
jgi:hypothetical protein